MIHLLLIVFVIKRDVANQITSEVRVYYMCVPVGHKGIYSVAV